MGGPQQQPLHHNQNHQHQRFSDDDGYRQPQHGGGGFDDFGSINAQDPDIWRPPTRDGPPVAIIKVGNGARGGAPPFRSAPPPPRASNDYDNGNRGGGNIPLWANRGPPPPAANAPGRVAPQQARVAPVSRPPPANKGGGNACGGGGGGYDKPWQKGMAPKEGAGKDKGQEKKKYVGPDPDLAVQLERDMMDGNPNIRWDDIAGLIDAKRVLEEAAVLPLIMPEYFIGKDEINHPPMPSKP